MARRTPCRTRPGRTWPASAWWRPWRRAWRAWWGAGCASLVLSFVVGGLVGLVGRVVLGKVIGQARRDVLRHPLDPDAGTQPQRGRGQRAKLGDVHRLAGDHLGLKKLGLPREGSEPAQGRKLDLAALVEPAHVGDEGADQVPEPPGGR